ncbi:MAG: Fic family protein [Micropruina sp.]|uniref:Fic/DOC family protein n=1 Tax=Micropruina sp. TaxID=2737536 RepID=UPI0039E54DD9
MADPYTYRGSHVLVNLPGYAHAEAWKEAEVAHVTARLVDLIEHPVAGDFDLAHLQAIHAALVDGFYSWGGRLRTTDTGPGGTGIAHCRPEFIRAEADRVFGELATSDHLRGRDRDAFSRGLAWTWGELTVIHPFRDVNTRTQFTFFNQLALHAGWLIDWTTVDPYLFGYARTVAIVSDERGIDALLYPALEPLTSDTSPTRALRSGANRFVADRPSWTRPELDRALVAAIERREAR